MVEMNELIRICPKCGSINLRQNPPVWDQKPTDVVQAKCMMCNHQGRDFPLIKKTVVKQFREKLAKK